MYSHDNVRIHSDQGPGMNGITLTSYDMGRRSDGSKGVDTFTVFDEIIVSTDPILAPAV